MLHHGDVVELGGVRMVAHHTPGHTPGCTTWTLQVEEDGTTYDVVFVGSPNALPVHRLIDNEDYPTIAHDFERTFEVMRNLEVDIFLASHGSFFHLDSKREKLAAGADGTVFVDPEGYAAFVERKEERFREELARQRAAAEAPADR